LSSSLSCRRLIRRSLDQRSPFLVVQERTASSEGSATEQNQSSTTISIKQHYPRLHNHQSRTEENSLDALQNRKQAEDEEYQSGPFDKLVVVDTGTGLVDEDGKEVERDDGSSGWVSLTGREGVSSGSRFKEDCISPKTARRKSCRISFQASSQRITNPGGLRKAKKTKALVHAPECPWWACTLLPNASKPLKTTRTKDQPCHSENGT
jgi:hypothetical protein